MFVSLEDAHSVFLVRTDPGQNRESATAENSHEVSESDFSPVQLWQLTTSYLKHVVTERPQITVWVGLNVQWQKCFINKKFKKVDVCTVEKTRTPGQECTMHSFD